ncbi:MAG: hypothetical protein ACI9JD_002331, partial [Rhodococcus sp. (in: high G+C Gram-positive bacteria)]
MSEGYQSWPTCAAGYFDTQKLLCAFINRGGLIKAHSRDQ